MKKKMPDSVKEKLNGKKFPREKEADRVRKRDVETKGETDAGEEKVREEKGRRKTRSVLRPTPSAKPPIGVQGRCILNPTGADLSKRH